MWRKEKGLRPMGRKIGPLWDKSRSSVGEFGEGGGFEESGESVSQRYRDGGIELQREKNTTSTHASDAGL